MIAAAVFAFGLWNIECDEQYARAAADILVARGESWRILILGTTNI